MRAVIGIYSIIDAKSNSNADTTDIPVAKIVDMNTFDEHPSVLEAVTNRALINSQSEETTDSAIWDITIPSKIKGIYFLNAKDNNPHRCNKDLYLTNAIIVVTDYYIEESDLHSWDLWVYPNFSR